MTMLAAVEACRSVVIAAADAAERDRRYPVAAVASIARTGLMSMCIPKVYGGGEVALPEQLAALRLLASIDGAAGWLAMISSTTSSMSMFLSEPGAREMFADANVITGGALAARGTAVAVEGGYRVSGRWPWGSGTAAAGWICGGALAAEGRMVLAFFPANDVTFHDTWHTHGLRGTGSWDYEVVDLFVPEHRVAYPMAGRRVVDCPLSRFPNFTLLASAVATVALGIAGRALAEIDALASVKQPMGSRRTLGQTGLVLLDVTRARAALEAAEAYLDQQVGAAWDLACAGDPVTVQHRARVRLAGVHAAQTAAATVDTAYTVAGGDSVFLASPLQRCLRDVHVATQHLMVSPRLLENLGRVLSGQDADTAML